MPIYVLGCACSSSPNGLSGSRWRTICLLQALHGVGIRFPRTEFDELIMVQN
jgi:hypothetical protein